MISDHIKYILYGLLIYIKIYVPRYAFGTVLLYLFLDDGRN